MKKMAFKCFLKLTVSVFCIFQASAVFAGEKSCHSFLKAQVLKTKKDGAEEELGKLKTLLSQRRWNQIQTLQQSLHLTKNIYEMISAGDAIYLLSNTPLSIGLTISDPNSILDRLSVHYKLKPWTESYVYYYDVLIVFNILEKLIPIDMDSKSGPLNYNEIQAYAKTIVLESSQFRKKRKQIKAKVLELIDLMMMDKVYYSSKVPKNNKSKFK